MDVGGGCSKGKRDGWMNDDAPSSNRAGRELQGARFSCGDGVVEGVGKRGEIEVKAEQGMCG